MDKPSAHTVPARFREAASFHRGLSDCFECLLGRYLELDSIYTDRFSKMWMWTEWLRKGTGGNQPLAQR